LKGLTPSRSPFFGQRGFTLVEIILAMIIFSTIGLYLLRTFSPATRAAADARQLSQLSLYLQDQVTYSKILGFWVWSGDTETANNSAHPIAVWQSRLATLGYTGRAQMAVTFLKYSDTVLVPFETEPFDGNEPRDKVAVSFTLFTTKNQPVTETVYLMLASTEVKAWATLHVIRRALLMYAADHGGSYPATGALATALVGAYLDEIPNDPFTSEQEKVTHQEEIVDWFYENNGGVVTLAANAQRSRVVSVLP
jgi:prepilin-type N-terminal cleavage/methylation domain-containing protein